MKRDQLWQKFLVLWEKLSVPEYKFGWRRETDRHAVFALTYGNEINGITERGLNSVLCFSHHHLRVLVDVIQKKAKKKKIKIIFVINLKKIWKKQMSNVRIKQAQLLLKRF
jgi:hypothetical protein